MNTLLRIQLTAFSLAALVLLAAAPPLEPDELVRKGNDAFERGDFAAAVGWFELAEERITDPGLVAFNKAAALYRLGRFREAELHYRRCLDAAVGPRRARACYDLGTALMRQENGANREMLESAIGCFEQCLAEKPAEADLAAAARHNLQLAKLLWLKAKPAATTTPKKDDKAPKKAGDGPTKEEPKKEKTPGVGEPGDNGNKGDPKTHKTLQPEKVKDKEGIETKELAPGSGNLPQVPDVGEPVTLDPADAAAHLQRAAERILRERREHQQRTAPAAPRAVKDW